MKSLPAFLSKPGNAFGLLAAFYICYMFLPRVVPQGMFVDGVLYASISRNLAEGRGTWWLPYFSIAYWIEGIPRNYYYENPPLLFWMQSVFFRVFGDHWWVEKLYATVLLLFNCFLITRIWKTVLKSINGEHSLPWLPVLFFYLIPIVFWGSAYNLIDSQLLTFCLLATWALVSGLINQSERALQYLLAVCFIFLGILTKGPVAVYPVALPFLYFMVFDRTKWWTGMIHSLILFSSVLLMFTLLLLLNPAALNFFKEYWNQRLSFAIMGGRSEGVRHGLGRLYVLWILLRENSILISLCLVAIILSYVKRIPIVSSRPEKKWALVFLFLAFAGTAPLALSTRQAGMYLIPSLVMFAIAAALFQYDFVKYLLLKISPRTAIFISTLMILGIISVSIYALTIFGKPSRDEGLLEDIHAIKPMIPKSNTIALADASVCSSSYNIYLQRYLELALIDKNDQAKLAVLRMPLVVEQDSILKSMGFARVYAGKKISLYKK